MRIESKICHLLEDKVIVQVYGWIDDKNVGSSLAEGATVEIAEDKAISRLTKRLNILSDNQIDLKSKNGSNENNQIKELVKNEIDKMPEASSVKQEPNDWSNELTAIDSEIRRLEWSRDDEIKFLEENLGYNNRNKITNYNELLNYLNTLKSLNNLNKSKHYTSDITSLIDESEIILKELSWDYNKGREYLRKEFNVSTRKDLNEQQLISFVGKLRSIRNQNLLR